MSNSPRFPWERDEEVLKIQTPEQTEISLVVADIGSRFSAGFVDLLLISVFILMVGILRSLMDIGMDEEGEGVFSGFVIALVWLSVFVYFILFEIAWNGQTPGKKMASIRVIQSTGRGLQPASAILRSIVRTVELSLPPLLLVMFFTRGRRRIGDLVAGTQVVRVIRDKPRPTHRGLLRPVEPGEELGLFAFAEAHRKAMFEEDLDLLVYLEESIEGKRYSERKKAMQSVVERYVLRFSMEEKRDEAQRAPERFLRELGLELRKKFEDRAF